jgi:hypothetical protein
MSKVISQRLTGFACRTGRHHRPGKLGNSVIDRDCGAARLRSLSALEQE